MAKGSKMTVFISIVAVVIFIVIVATTSFAYYTFSVKKENENNANTNIRTSNISASFIDGEIINKQNMIPGDSFTKTFTLENNGDAKINYKVVIQEVENTFISKSDIEVVVKENDEIINQTTFPSATSAISDVLTLSPHVSKSYTITITYKNTSDDQKQDMGKKISGKIFIEEV